MGNETRKDEMMNGAAIKTEKTMTNSQMKWNLKNGFAWTDNGVALEEYEGTVFHTQQASYDWDPMRQLYVSF
jgi:hypothetical protein